MKMTITADFSLWWIHTHTHTHTHTHIYIMMKQSLGSKLCHFTKISISEPALCNVVCILIFLHFPFCQWLTTLTFLLVNYSYTDHNSKKIPIQMLHNSISTLYLHINPLSSFLCCFLSAKFVICPRFWTMHYVYASSTIQFHNLGFASSIPRLLYSKCTYIKPVTLHFTFKQSSISISFS